ncbi:hypothetical protein [Neisseria canis]|uniref:Uncharacterized protein n=1 Tax=Neisseria canis TaxID=493 RepID=A0A1X3CZY1_9NEIS|nr:hypothetical protein [Neisseria canis]OSI12847.1 hypothetical protein BWD07_03105 [Neisseria canis]VEF02142.1 Uncharacterised protein [Neisseria canis]
MGFRQAYSQTNGQTACGRIKVWLKPAWIGVWFAAVYFAGNGLVFCLQGSSLAAPVSYVTAWPFSLFSSEYTESYGSFLMLNSLCWYAVGHVLYNISRITGKGVPAVSVMFMFVYAVVLAIVFVLL